MESLTVGHNGSVFFENPLRSSDGTVDSLSVRVGLDGLQANQRIAAIDGFSDLANFFRDLSLNWRGWSGSKIYESLEGDLVLCAEHDGHIRLAFTLSQGSKVNGWSLSAKVTLDPGEELAMVAEDLELMLR